MTHRIIIRLLGSSIKGYPHEWGSNLGACGAIAIDDLVELHGTPEQFRALADAANDLADNIESLR